MSLPKVIKVNKCVKNYHKKLSCCCSKGLVKIFHLVMIQIEIESNQCMLISKEKEGQ